MTEKTVNHSTHRHLYEPPDFHEINRYAYSLIPPRPDEVLRMEEIAREQRFPIIGAVCGYLCYQYARLINAKRIFELGSGYGYSTYWFARAVRENGGGIVHHTVFDEELSEAAQKHIEKLGMKDLVKFHLSEAVQALNETGGEYDLLFCDIDKHGYPDALEAMERHLRPGGLVIFDNMLLGGSVLPSHEEKKPEPTDTPELHKWREQLSQNLHGVRQTTEKLFKSSAWISTLIPLRDGMAVGMKVTS